MSDQEADGKAGQWTEAEKFEFLLRVIDHLKGEGRSMDWKKLQMRGRTTKSLMHMWAKINKMAGQMKESQDSGTDGPITPQPTPTKKRGRKPGVKKTTVKVKGSDDEEDKIEMTGKHALAGTPSGRAKRVKTEQDVMMRRMHVDGEF